MERDRFGANFHIIGLAEQAKTILSDSERVYDLVGRRLALRCVELAPLFASDIFRLGVIGHPNKGKTTLAYSYFLALKMYGVPTAYFDLDLYSSSGAAISGQIGWDERLKRPDVSRAKVKESIASFEGVGPGMVIGDFPGRIDNPYQRDRLEAVDLALILGDDVTNRKLWQDLTEKSGTLPLWLRSQSDGILHHPLDPTIVTLNRNPKPTSIDVLISLTRILEVIAEMKDISLLSPWPFFSQAERMVLEEILDFSFAPLV